MILFLYSLPSDPQIGKPGLITTLAEVFLRVIKFNSVDPNVMY